MKSLRSLTLTLALALGAPAICFAEPTLKIGDAAPSIKTGDWVQGDPVKEFSKDNVYVVEFWATWCGPCRATIPHLDALHEELKDKNVVFIGQNCLEKDTDKVKPFVEKMGEKMSYRVALDDTSDEEKGFMAVNWMEAAEQNGIPCAFVVDKTGHIAWIGHPAQLKAGLLKEVVAGTFDVKKAAAAQEKAAAVQKVMMKAGPKLGKAIQASDWEEAVDIVDKIEKENPEMADHLVSVRFFIAMKSGDTETVVKCADKTLSGPMGEEPQALNEVAWRIATELKNPPKEALDVAAKVATRAVEITKSGDAAILDTLARVQFLQGKKDEAVKTEEAAVSKAPEEMKSEMEKTLKAYKAGKLPSDKNGKDKEEEPDNEI